MTKPEQRLSQLMIRMRKMQLGEFPHMDFDLTFSQMEMLGFIARSPDCHVQDIADGLGLTAPTVSVSVRRLEDAGWLERKPDPEDGRAFCISLTPKSMKTMEKAKTAKFSAMQNFLTGLTGEEQEQFLGLLEKAIEAAVARSQERTDKSTQVTASKAIK